MHEKWKEVCKTDWSKESRTEGSLSGQGSMAENARESFFSAKDEQVQASDRRSALRESLLSLWQVDVNQTLRVCEGGQAQLEAPEASCVSYDRLDDPLPYNSEFCMKNQCFRRSRAPGGGRGK